SRFRLFRFRSPLLTESLRFLFLGLLRCFTSPRFASPDYEFIRSIIQSYLDWVVPFGDPRIVAWSGFPWLIAAYYVLHRLLAPRHSPFALSSLITKLNHFSMETQRIVFALIYL